MLTQRVPHEANQLPDGAKTDGLAGGDDLDSPAETRTFDRVELDHEGARGGSLTRASIGGLCVHDFSVSSGPPAESFGNG